MWGKIKTAFSIIGAVLSIVLFTVILFLLRRGKADGRRSGDDSERNQRIKEGIGKCEEHLQRADDILRNAIKRSREAEPDA